MDENFYIGEILGFTSGIILVAILKYWAIEKDAITFPMHAPKKTNDFREIKIPRYVANSG